MLTIYGAPPSIHTRKVVVAALEKQLEYAFEFVLPFDPPPRWRELSPTGKIPALTDGDFHLGDSSVIVAYLERKFPHHPLYPEDPREFAQALWFEEYADSTIAPDISAIFQEKIVNPTVRNKPTDDTIVSDRVKNQLPPKFDYLERSLRGDYFVGRALSIADITVASDLTVYHYLGNALDDARYPKLIAHFKAMLRRSSFQTALKAEQPFAERMHLDRSFLQRVLS
jgi:glutathione S-transferase